MPQACGNLLDLNGSPARGLATPAFVRIVRAVRFLTSSSNHSLTAFRVALVLSVLLMNMVMSLESSRPRAPVTKRIFSATLVAVFRNGNTRYRSDSEPNFNPGRDGQFHLHRLR
jgi:hypothetical protein